MVCLHTVGDLVSVTRCSGFGKNNNHSCVVQLLLAQSAPPSEPAGWCSNVSLPRLFLLPHASSPWQVPPSGRIYCTSVAWNCHIRPSRACQTPQRRVLKKSHSHLKGWSQRVSRDANEIYQPSCQTEGGCVPTLLNYFSILLNYFFILLNYFPTLLKHRPQ